MLNRWGPAALLLLTACAAPPQTTYWCLPASPPPSYWAAASRGPGPSEETARAEVARLLAETVPLYQEVADEWERGFGTKPEIELLFRKARRVERNLEAIRALAAAHPDACEPGGRLEELLAAIKTCLRQLEPRKAF